MRLRGAARLRLGRARRQRPSDESGGVAATQEALYKAHDLELSWSEASLPERERTKHVHRLHPYLGKFIPQLVETLLDRHVPAGGRVLDPFAGSGTTLVQALESGYDATGVDIAGFNALLARVKTRPYNLEALRRDLLWAHAEAEAFEPRGPLSARRHRLRARLVRAGCGRGAAALPLARRAGRLGGRAAHRAGALGPFGAAHGALRPRVPARAPARAVLVLQAPARVQAGRVGPPVPAALHARHARADRGVRGRAGRRLRRADAARRRPRDRSRRPVRRRHHVAALSGPDRLPRAAPLRVRAARRRRAARSRARPARAGHGPGGDRGLRRRRCATCSRTPARRSRLGGRMCIVVNDRRDLYPEILRRAGLRLVDRHERHVNRRTGRRAGEYFESILVAARR